MGALMLLIALTANIAYWVANVTYFVKEGFKKTGLDSLQVDISIPFEDKTCPIIGGVALILFKIRLGQM